MNRILPIIWDTSLRAVARAEIAVAVAVSCLILPILLPAVAVPEGHHDP